MVEVFVDDALEKGRAMYQAWLYIYADFVWGYMLLKDDWRLIVE